MTWDFAIVLFIVVAVSAGLILRSRLRARAKAKAVARAKEEGRTGNRVHVECMGACEGCSFANKEISDEKSAAQ